jgi:hypothetical protein
MIATGGDMLVDFVSWYGASAGVTDYKRMLSSFSKSLQNCAGPKAEFGREIEDALKKRSNSY